MNIETKYRPGDNVYIVVGLDDKAKVLESTISSINIDAAISATKVIYNCKISRLDAGNVVVGMPTYYTVERAENKIYETTEDCFNSIVVKPNENKHK